MRRIRHNRRGGAVTSIIIILLLLIIIVGAVWFITNPTGLLSFLRSLGI
jgi:hypothetical protein